MNEQTRERSTIIEDRDYDRYIKENEDKTVRKKKGGGKSKEESGAKDIAEDDTVVQPKNTRGSKLYD